MDEDCPPGAEGYEDSVTQKPTKKPVEDSSCTKAEQEFQEHLNSLKIKVENGDARPMVERRGRDVSGKWIYLCFPCGAMCSGESVLQTHISGKKHKTKLALRSVWPKSIFEEHPYVMHEKGNSTKTPSVASEKVLQKMVEEVDLHNKPPSELDAKYNKYREVRCHIQDSIDNVKAPLLGLEYLIEHPPEQTHYEPSYICVLCSKQGHPRTIINHLTCFWHRYNYLVRHFAKASALLAPYRGQNKYREGVNVVMNRLAQRIEDKYGRLRPVNIDKEEYDKDKEVIHQWVFKSKHFTEQMGPSFEEVVDVDLINSLHKSNEESKTASKSSRGRDPSPPIVAAPIKPVHTSPRVIARRQERPISDNLSDISDDLNPRRERDDRFKDRHEVRHDTRYRPYEDRRREPETFRTRYALKNNPADKIKPAEKDKARAPNYEYKVKLAEDKRKAAEDSAKKTLAYHEKNPEKHPLYPEEWKKFWNRRYKEIQAEGKDPSKHDFKPEWIVFWTTRMKELHEEELRVEVNEIYRKLCLSPPDMNRRSPPDTRRSPPRRREADARREPDLRREINARRDADLRQIDAARELNRREADARRREPEPRRPEHDRRRSAEGRRRSAEPRRRSAEPRRPPPDRRRSPPPNYRRDRRSPEPRRHSPTRHHLRTRSRSPIPRSRSPARTHITLDSLRRSRSPLSRRGELSRNRSPGAPPQGPASQTVMISDDELHTEEVLSPWNSDNELDSLGSLPDAKSPVRARSQAGSAVSSRASRPRHASHGYTRSADPQDLGPAENVVATLRMLVALEDYLGSLGPKVVDLLTEALRLEKEQPNSSEDLLERETAVVLIETAKEKLKGSMQAGLVPPSAHPALRAAVVRAASTLHEADTRARRKQSRGKTVGALTSAMALTGSGEVNRTQIAQQMAAALIAQGKTDVSSEELAQLVDAVVGMAEKKKREAEVKAKQESRAKVDAAARPAAPAPPAASALQMLQSAYDENDKKAEREDQPDAMDGLSDSDLETLLKNFNELSAEEQHSLIAYLKKLEAREPARVERLRQYVSAAATAAPPQAAAAPAPAAAAPAPPAAAPPPRAADNTVTIESDDDDYTVEEVFKLAKQKVKEDQMRQEMEIVKKSLKVIPAEKIAAGVDLVKNISSAAGLLALVQASMHTGGARPPARPDPLPSGARPRMFGDAPDPPARNPQFSPPGAGPFNEPRQSNFDEQDNFGPNQDDFDRNQNDFAPNQDDFGPSQGDFGPNQGDFGPNQGDFGSNQDDFGPNQGDFGPNQGDFGSNQDDFAPNQDDFAPNQDNFGPNQDDFGPNQDGFGSNQDDFVPNQDDFAPNQDDFAPNQDDFGPNRGNFGGPNDDYDGSNHSGNFSGSNQGGNFGGLNRDGNFGGLNRGGNFSGPNQGGNFRGGFGNQSDNFGGPNLRGNFGGPNRGGNFGGPNRGGNFGGPNRGDNLGGLRQDSDFDGPNRGGKFGGPNQGGDFSDLNEGGSFGGLSQGSNFGGSNQGGNFGSSNRGNFGGRNQGNFGGPNQSSISGLNQGNFGGPNKGNFGGSSQGNRNFPSQLSPWEKNNPTKLSPWEKDTPLNDNRGPLMRTPGLDQFNQGPRGNFINGRPQDNFDKRPMNQLSGNFQGNNFRGRGGGRGNFRGRGRGHY